jgi:hypothetical protein
VNVSGLAAAPYVAWNDALADRFFQPSAAGQQVYLYVTENVIGEVGRLLGGGVGEFRAAVRAGPPGTTRSGHCQRALQVARGWRGRGLAYPPYVAYLSLFVLAGGHEGHFAPHAYYPRLWELLGEPGEGSPPSFHRMIELWDDLERWSIQDCAGQLGIFEARNVGEWIHVGLPLAQTVLTEAERRMLPKVFADAHLDPDIPPSTRELQRALVEFGRTVMRPRTLAAIERGPDAFKRALLDTVADDFLAWDGGSAAASDGGQPKEVWAGLRLCLAVDRVAGTARVSIRFHSKREIPEEGLEFAGAGVRLRGEEYAPGWSSPIADATTGRDFTPPQPAWASGMALGDTKHGWKVRLRPARLRIFVEGAAEGLPDLIEAVRLPLRRPFYLAFRAADWPSLREWVQRDCCDWRELAMSSGLPAGWTFAAVGEARTDQGLRALDAALALPDRVSVRVVGGIRRSTAGNTFLAFAPPRLVVDGAGPDDVICCGDRVLEDDSDAPGTYELPKDLADDTRTVIEVRRGDDTIRRVSLYLIAGFPWRFDAPLVFFDGLDRLIDGSSKSGGIVGAAVPPVEEPLLPDLLRTPGLSSAASRVYFVGNAPGAISIWPAEPLPAWKPVWAIPFGERGRAIYCGEALSAARPTAQRRGSRKQLALWRRVLWRWRKKITLPQDKHLKALWRQYREAARDA